MKRPRITRASFIALVIHLSVWVSINGKQGYVAAQQSETQTVQTLHEKALKSLKAKKHEEVLADVEAALKIDPNFAPGWLLKAQTLMGLFITKYDVSEAVKNLKQPFGLLKEAAAALDRYLELKPEAVNAKALREQFETLRTYGQLADKDDPSRTLFSPKEATTKARILSREEPTYPDMRISGRVVLLGVATEEGQVKYIIVLRSPNSEFTKQCVEAARKTKLKPAIKDGRSISTVIQFEYQFNGI